MNDLAPPAKRTAKDFATDQEVRWCPGCGDYAILRAVQKTLGILTLIQRTLFLYQVSAVLPGSRIMLRLMGSIRYMVARQLLQRVSS